MSSWIDQDKAVQGFHDQNMAGQGTGGTMAGQHDITAEERQGLNSRFNTFSYEYNGANPGMLQENRDKVNASYKIGQASEDKLFSDQDKAAYLEQAKKTSLGDVNDPAARMKAMSFVTQDRAGAQKGDVDGSVCAGASIVGAAYLAEGPDGLKAVMKAIEKQDPGGKLLGAKANPEYAALKEKMKTDPNSLTVADLQALQLSTYSVLKQQQEKSTGWKPGDPEVSGIHNKEMDKFLEKSPDLAEMLKKNGMEVEFIDNDGKIDKDGHTNPDHYVVKMTGKDGKKAIYDPNARRGGQIIDHDAGVETYEKATQDHIGDAIKPYQ